MRALWSHLIAVSNCKLSPKIRRLSAANMTSNRNLPPIISTEDPEIRDFVGFLESVKNYEKSGVPKGAGTDSGEGFDLGRMKRLMLRLHNPHFKYKVVHVAGTKGKGSTSAFLSNILQAGGYSVGCYSSPHILNIKERISCNGHPVSASTLNDLFYSIKPILEQSIQEENGSLSHFEVTNQASPKILLLHKTTKQAPGLVVKRVLTANISLGPKDFAGESQIIKN